MFYRGLLYNILANTVMFIPFINYKYNSLEQTRIAFLIGHYNGLKFESYRDAKYYIKENGNFKRGKFLINTPIHLYNIVAFYFIVSMFTKQNYAENEDKKE